MKRTHVLAVIGLFIPCSLYGEASIEGRMTQIENGVYDSDPVSAMVQIGDASYEISAELDEAVDGEMIIFNPTIKLAGAAGDGMDIFSDSNLSVPETATLLCSLFVQGSQPSLGFGYELTAPTKIGSTIEFDSNGLPIAYSEVEAGSLSYFQSTDQFVTLRLVSCE